MAANEKVICKNCIYDSKVPEITFDPQGNVITVIKSKSFQLSMELERRRVKMHLKFCLTKLNMMLEEKLMIVLLGLVAALIHHIFCT